VGGHAAHFLADRGAVVVAASDSAGAVVNPEGLDVAALAACKAEGGSVASFPGGSSIPRDDLLGVDCDLLVPAARPDVLTVGNAELVRASVILKGPTSRPPGRPSSCCTSAGCSWCPISSPTPAGVICAAVEHQGGTQAQALALVQEKVGANTTEVLRQARELGPHRRGHRLPPPLVTGVICGLGVRPVW
jgi:glutamate dehydrogenase/leucine dehydrogenase